MSNMIEICEPKKDKVIGFFFAIFAFLRLGPFIIWDTYMSGFFSHSHIFVFLMIVFLFFIFYLNNRGKLVVIKTDFNYFVAAVVITITLLGICGLKISGLFSSEWIAFGSFLLYILVPDDCKVKTYKYYKVIFSVTLVPAIVYYFLNNLGVGGFIPHEILSSIESIKVNHGSYYVHYPCAVQLLTPSDLLSSFRLCGIYDEAGRLGTMAGMFLVAERFQIKNNVLNLIIFIGGICSLSIAFYLIVIIYFVISNFISGKPKNAIALLGVVVVYFVFLNIDFNNDMLNTIQSRLQITSDGLVGDNRTNARFDRVYAEYLEGSLFELLFGYGNGAIQLIQQQGNIDGSSYKCYLYNYGIIGFGTTIIWTITYVIKKLEIKLNRIYLKKNIEYVYGLTLLCIYVINLYQRPTVFHMSYMVIIIGGSLAMKKVSEVKVIE